MTLKREEYIYDLISQGEHQQLDFKFEIADSRKIARTLVAFANTDGGKLLIGVKDNGIIAGVRSEEEYYMAEAAAQLYSKPEVKFSVKEHEVEGKYVVEILVPKSRHKPHFAAHKDGKWLAYVRIKDQNILACATLLKLWEREKLQDGVVIHYTENEKILLEYLEENPSITLQKYTWLTGLSWKKAEKILLDFILLDVIEIVMTEKETVYRLKPLINPVSQQ